MLVCGSASRNGDFQSGIPPNGSLVPGTAGKVGGGSWQGQPFAALFPRPRLMMPPMIATAVPA
jgi:hypothetical protein